ncbi:MAG: putative deacylase [Bradymonadia bacterium]|jgi:predicted deacylase
MKYSSSFRDSTVLCADVLNVEDCPTNARTRLAIQLSQDALGRAVRVPVIVVRGRRSGPVFGVTSALHGNEVNGIPVVHRLVETLNPHVLRGTVVVCPVLNVSGFMANQREFRDGTDLNHVMPGNPAGNESNLYGHRIVERIVSKLDVLVDLHTASFGRVNSLYVRANMEEPTTAALAILQRPQLILHNPPSDKTLRGAAAALGIPAITVEVGDPQVFQQRHIRPTLAGIRAMLSEMKMLPKRPKTERPMPILCRQSSWVYTSHGGLLDVIPGVGEAVEQGQLIARQTDAFGDLVAEYLAAEDGFIIGKNVNPVAPAGARIAHIGLVADANAYRGNVGYELGSDYKLSEES